MRPNEVREEVQAQHRALRDLMTAARDAAVRVLYGDDDPAANEVFQRSFTALAVRFDAHMAFEEEHLVPLLTKGHAHGPVRRQRVHADHARQRRLLQEIVRGFAEPPAGPRVQAALVRLLVTDLVDDMAFEDGILLREDALWKTP